MKITNPILLYDNLLIGRKRSASSKKSKTDKVSNNDVDENTYIEDLNEYEKYVDLLNFNPNLILYGPPGTGKTFATQKIIEAFEKDFNKGEYISFEDIEKEGRAKFITFHQSYSYEEFIEGIRPELSNDTESDGNSKLKYKIEDGVLKKISNATSRQYLKDESNKNIIDEIRDSSKIWKVSLGSRKFEDNIYTDCKKNNDIAVGWLNNESLENLTYDEIFDKLENEREEGDSKPINDASSLDAIVNEMNNGDIVLIYNSPTEIRDIGVVKSDYYYKEGVDYPHRRKVTWIKEFDKPVSIYDYNGQKRLTLKTIYELTRLNFSDIKNIIQENSDEDTSNKANEQYIKPYYLIIDEINRGNISKIFGELITLIEKDKRNDLSCVLPYSQKPFTIPENLYLIGTMNTADPSIAVIDTALRRRFTFVEVEPNITVFDDPSIDTTPEINNIDLAKLLETLNKIITEKIDRDHRIGHSYFMNLFTLNDLYNTWYYRILPLLTEYFYDDLETLKTVIGDKFYDNYGNTIFLSKVREDNTVTNFEKALLAIYEDYKNE